MAPRQPSVTPTLPPSSVAIVKGASPKAARADGEPRQRDAERSQRVILDAARDEFSSHGLGGARMDRIAERAGLNKKLIYYYFDNKDKLFLAVLEDTYANIREAEQQLNLTALPPVQAIRKLTEFTWHYYLKHPEFLTLLNSENLHGGRHLAASRRARKLNSPLLDMIADVLARGHQSGEFRAGVDPMQLYISMAGVSYFYLGNQHTLSAIFGRDLLSLDAQADRLKHIGDLIVGFLRP